MAETTFRLKGIRWNAGEFIAALREIARMHRTLTGRRVAYHFGVTEKAVRDLQRRSPLAADIMATVKAEVSKHQEKPARYREYSWWHSFPTSEMQNLYDAARNERERQSEIRRLLPRQQKATARKNRANEKARRYQAVQSCRLASMTQAETATQLMVSLSTVKRYWR